MGRTIKVENDIYNIINVRNTDAFYYATVEKDNVKYFLSRFLFL